MKTLKRTFFDSVFNADSHAIQVLEPVRDKSGKIIDFRFESGNDHTPGLLSQFPEAMQGQLFRQLVHVLETGQPFSQELSFGENGKSNWIRLKAQKVRDLLVFCKEDLTSSKLAEERLMQLNRALFAKNRELETLSSELKTFNSIAATDYNETLRGLYTSMEFIISNDARNLSDAGKANVRRAQAAVQKLKLLTEDIIAFSKITTDEPPSPVNLDEVIKQVLVKMQQKIVDNNAVITYGNLPVIQGYPLLLSILFSHLIDNAIKFRKADLSPEVTINYSQQHGNSIDHSSANKELRYDVISVIDNGIGFDVKEGEKIFTMFYRLTEKGKPKGSGIGLAICKKVMDLHDGFISSECTPECTTFRCFFPVSGY